MSGFLIDWLAKRDVRWPMWILVVAFLLAAPFQLAFLYASNYTMTLVWAVPAIFFSFLYAGPSYVLVQGLAGPRLRATAAAVYIMVTNIIAVGGGPGLVGVLSDWFGSTGSHLGLALAIILLSFPLGAVCLLIGVKTFPRDLAAARLD
jgi:hypothetical protein